MHLRHDDDGVAALQLSQPLTTAFDRILNDLEGALSGLPAHETKSDLQRTIEEIRQAQSTVVPLPVPDQVPERPFTTYDPRVMSETGSLPDSLGTTDSGGNQPLHQGLAQSLPAQVEGEVEVEVIDVLEDLFDMAI